MVGTLASDGVWGSRAIIMAANGVQSVYSLGETVTADLHFAAISADTVTLAGVDRTVVLHLDMIGPGRPHPDTGVYGWEEYVPETPPNATGVQDAIVPQFAETDHDPNGVGAP